MQNFFHAIIASLLSGVSAILFAITGISNSPQPTPHNTQLAASVLAAVSTEQPQAQTNSPNSSIATTSQAVISGSPVINNSYITEPVVVRTVNQFPTSTQDFVTKGDLAARLSSLEETYNNALYGSPSSTATTYTGGALNEIAFTNNISQLTGTTLNNITVNGVAGLTDADIPDNITVNNYLPLSGGTLTGDLNVGGNFTVTGSQSFSGGISGSYFNATTTTATSTFGGGATFANNGLFILQNGRLQAAPLGNSWPTSASGGANWGPRDTWNEGISKEGLIGIAGYSRASDQTGAATESIGAAGFVITDKVNRSGWGLYSDVQFQQGNYGYGAEIAVKNESGVDSTSSPYFATTGTYGIWLPAGGDASYGGAPTNPSNAAIAIGHNSSTWNKGIVFFQDGLSTSTSGTANAIEMAKGMEVEWYTPSNTMGAMIRSDVTTSGDYHQLLFQDNNVIFWNGNNSRTFDIVHTTSGVNWLRATDAVTSASPALSAQGADSNVSISLTPKGTGNVLVTAGNLGLSVASPTYKLDVSGLGHFTSLVDATNFVATSTSATSTFGGGITGPGNFAVESGSGFLGIGTTSPTVPLAILTTTSNTAGSGAIQFNNSTSVGQAWSMRLDNTLVDLVFDREFGGTWTEAFRLARTTGNIGIGTTSPMSMLSLSGGDLTISGNKRVLNFQDVGNSNRLAQMGLIDGFNFKINLPTGNLQLITNDVGIGTTTPGGKLAITGLGTSNGYTVLAANSSNVPVFNVQDNGSTGVGTSSPWRTFSVTGTVGFDGLTGSTGAGSLCLDANRQVVYNAGSDSCLSSLRSTKHDIELLDLSGTTTIASLTPVSFIYNNDASGTTRYGFIAEDASAVDTHLATHDALGQISGIDDRAIISVIVKALQEIMAQINSIAALIASFSDHFTTNILSTNTITSQVETTQKLCVGSTCITEDQLKTLLATAKESSVAPPPVSSAPPPDSSNTTTTPDQPSAPEASTTPSEDDSASSSTASTQ